MNRSREPLLADRIVATGVRAPGLMSANEVARACRKVSEARVFVLDENAVDRLAQVVREVPELLAEHSNFARAPFDVCWIEFDHRRFWENMTGIEADDNTDFRVGFLIEDNAVSVASGGMKSDPGGLPVFSPVRYRLNQPTDYEGMEAFVRQAHTTMTQVDTFLWGKSWLRLNDVNRVALRERHSFEIISRSDVLVPTLWRMLVEGSSGEVRTILAALLLINRPSLTRYVTDVPRGRGFIKGKMQPFLSYTVATIDLDPLPTLKTLTERSDEDSLRRRHDVRGHWCRNDVYREGTRTGCVHVMEPSGALDKDDKPRAWTCGLCDGRRWWRNAHERGDATQGWVSKEWSVQG